MPRLRLLCAALAASVTLAPSASAQTVVIGPGAGALSAAQGGQFTVPVVADLTASGGASLGSLSARLLWRPVTARFVGAMAGAAGTPAFNADTVTGELRFALASAGGVTGTTVIAQAVFQAMGAPGDTMTLRVAVDEATSGSFTDLLPFVTPTAAGFCVSGGMYGDLNADGQTNGFDALLIVTHAVGLSTAPYSTLNGDVDSDGNVTTRDALGVLSAAVGLPTPGFRIGLINTGSCAVGVTASVVVGPAGLVLAPGDQVLLAATQRDSANAIIGGPQPSWLARYDTVAAVDSTGRVTAVGAGTTHVLAIVGPGVMDSVAVTVGPARRTWYVDPAIAAGNTVELGSAAYPFSTLQQAVDAAGAAGDTVRVAAASYGAGAVIANKDLVVIGDSGATGFPRLSGAFAGPALYVDSVGSLSLSGLVVERSALGIQVRRSGAITLSRFRTDNTGGPGIHLREVASASLTDVAVTVAGSYGIDVDSIEYVAMTRVRVDGVSGAGSDSPTGISVRVIADSLRVDSASWRGGTAMLQTVGLTLLRHTRIAEAAGPLLQATAGTLVLDTAQFYLAGDEQNPAPIVSLNSGVSATLRGVSIAQVGGQALYVSAPVINVRGASITRDGGSTTLAEFGYGSSVTIAQSAFSNGRVNFGSTQVRIDTTTFTLAPVETWYSSTFNMTGGALAGRDSIMLNLYSTTARLAHVALTNGSVYLSSSPTTFDTTTFGNGAGLYASSSTVVFHGGSLTGMRRDAKLIETSYGSLTLSQVALATGRLYFGYYSTNQLDTTTLANVGLESYSASRFGMRGGSITAGDSLPLLFNYTPRVAFHDVALTGFTAGADSSYDGGPYAVKVVYGDSVRMDSVWGHDNQGGILYTQGTPYVSLFGNRFENNHGTARPGPLNVVRLESFTGARVAQTVFDHGAVAARGEAIRGIASRMGTFGSRLQIDTSTFLGGKAISVNGYTRNASDTLGLRSVRVAPAGGMRTWGVYADNIGRLEATGVEIDSVVRPRAALYGLFLGSFAIDSSRFTNLGGAVRAQADSVLSPGAAVFTNNYVECDTLYSPLQYVVSLNGGPMEIVRNTMRGTCFLGIVSSNSLTGAPSVTAIMTDNDVLLPAKEGGPGAASALSIQGAIRQAVVARNVSQGIILISSTSATMDTVRVDSNTVKGTYRGGIEFGGTIRGLSLRGNTVDSVYQTASRRRAYSFTATGGVPARLVGNTARRAQIGFGLPNLAADTTIADSNVVVETGLAVAAFAGRVFGRWNYIARNDTGLVGNGYVQMDSSVFQQNLTQGARNFGTTTWQMTANFWGDPAGPRCDSCSNTSPASDYVLGPMTYIPYLTAAPGSTPVGAPRFLASGAFLSSPTPARTSRAGATRAVAPGYRTYTATPLLGLPVAAPEPAPLLPEVIW